MTSIEWFYNELKHIIPNDFLGKFEYAKELHEKEILNAINITSENNVIYANKIINALLKIENIEGELFMHNKKIAQDYYNENFKK